MKVNREVLKKWLILPPIILGVIVFWLLTRNRPEPKRSPEKEVRRALRVIRVPKVDVVPRILGYGTAEPGQTWRAVAEVKGRAVEVHPELKSGAVISAGTELLKIDPKEYEIAVARTEANIEQVNAQIAELDAQETNTRASLKIEERSLGLAEQSLARKRELLTKGVIPKDDVDREERAVLTPRQALQSLKNTLRLLPAQRKSLETSLAVQKANLEDAKLDLSEVSIRTPFACRLADVSIEKGQFLNTGQTLFEAYSIAVTEVPAEFAMGKFRNLLDPEVRMRFYPSMTMENVRELLRFEAMVRVRSGELMAEWEGRFDRVRERVDPKTRALTVVVAVDKPYQKIVPGKRPPLAKGMFCEVELRTEPKKDRIVIPRSALHGGAVVYVLNDQNRLERRDVRTAFEQSNFVCLASGLEEGETLIVSDPAPAIEGMLAKPVPDEELLQGLLAEARGEAPLR